MPRWNTLSWLGHSRLTASHSSSWRSVVFVVVILWPRFWQHLLFRSFDCLPSVLWCYSLDGRKGIHPVKNWVVGCWHSYLSGVRCRLAYGPADVTATHCLLLQNADHFSPSGTGSPGSPGQWPLNGCMCVCVCVLTACFNDATTHCSLCCILTAHHSPVHDILSQAHILQTRAHSEGQGILSPNSSNNPFNGPLSIQPWFTFVFVDIVQYL